MASRHLYGPRKVKLADDEVAAVCMLKNGAYYLDTLMAHHRSLGVKHFLFIDNGSDDGTIEQLEKYDDVTIVSNKLPVAHYECKMRAIIARQVFDGGWFLFLDSDELMDIVNSDSRSIRDDVRYCNEHGYNIVVGYVLDMYSSSPLAETSSWSYAQSVEHFDQYSISTIDEYDYHQEGNPYYWFLQTNTISNDDIKIKMGGIRRQVFSEYCGLTVHRLVRNTPSIDLYRHSHCSCNAICADFTMLVRHYKFAGPYLERERKSVSESTWMHGEDALRLQVIEGDNFRLSGEDEKKFINVMQLVEEGFLVCSDDYLAHASPANV